jgi:D-lactate dehydrogenase
VGVVGTGNIGVCAAKIFLGFGCTVLAQSRSQNKELLALGVEYVSLDELCARSQVISLHAPLVPATHHVINAERISLMKQGVVIVNTSRGGLLDTQAAIAGLKSGKIGGLGLDVYEEEAGLFFKDHTGEVIEDDVFHQLVNYPNVVVTGHQAFLTVDALENIADATLDNVGEFRKTLAAGGAGTGEAGGVRVEMKNEVKADEETMRRARSNITKGKWKGVTKLVAMQGMSRETFWDEDEE